MRPVKLLIGWGMAVSAFSAMPTLAWIFYAYGWAQLSHCLTAETPISCVRSLDPPFIWSAKLYGAVFYASAAVAALAQLKINAQALRAQLISSISANNLNHLREFYLLVEAKLENNSDISNKSVIIGELHHALFPASNAFKIGSFLELSDPESAPEFYSIIKKRIKKSENAFPNLDEELHVKEMKNILRQGGFNLSNYPIEEYFVYERSIIALLNSILTLTHPHLESLEENPRYSLVY